MSISVGQVKGNPKEAAELIAVLEAEIERLRAMLTEARGAIAHLDPMALGGQTANHPEDQEWYFRDELLSRIDAALTGVSKQQETEPK